MWSAIQRFGTHHWRPGESATRLYRYPAQSQTQEMPTFTGNETKSSPAPGWRQKVDQPRFAALPVQQLPQRIPITDGRQLPSSDAKLAGLAAARAIFARSRARGISAGVLQQGDTLDAEPLIKCRRDRIHAVFGNNAIRCCGRWIQSSGANLSPSNNYELAQVNTGIGNAQNSTPCIF